MTLRIYIIIGTIAAAITAAAYWSYSTTLSKVEQLTSELTATQAQLTLANQSIDALVASSMKQAELDKQLQVKLSQAESRVQELKTLLAEHDLEFLALQKPGLIERKINDATAKVFSNLERATGSQ